MKFIVITFFVVFFGVSIGFTQITPVSGYPIFNKGSVADKNFYLLELLKNNTKVRRQIEHDPVLTKMLTFRNKALIQSLSNCKNYKDITTKFKFTSSQISTVSAELAKLYMSNADIRHLVNANLIPSYKYSGDIKISPAAQFTKAWEQDAEAINHIISVYAEGSKANYPAIDSISFNVYDKNYIYIIKEAACTAIDESDRSKMFFMPATTFALKVLAINGRNDAGDYEPMAKTVNKAALSKSKHIIWSAFSYTLILVPGEGPDDNNISLSEGSKFRCKLAVNEYHNGLAPFIMVSGGKIHPYKTPYCEAIEMRKYLIDSLKIPINSIITEPHARHTTTNMRNASRLIIQYHFPVNMAALVTTDSLQSAYISNMDQRCQHELGFLPYRLGKRINTTCQEFYALPIAFRVNNSEPLDP
ncbi:YdcF family protein [Mucilaginibacter sp.]